MAPIDSVNIRTRSLSTDWYSRSDRLRSIVRLGLESDGYIVLTVDDNVSVAAQGAQLRFSKIVDCREPHANDYFPTFLKQLEHKTLLNHRPGEISFLKKVSDDFALITDAVLRVCLQAVGMPGNALADVLDDPEPLPYMPSSSLLQAISYSGSETSAAAAHVDRGLLTVVWDDAPGLQVQSPAGVWQPVILKANQVAVFAGETLQHATCGRIPAAVHKVILDPATYQTVGGSSARISLAYKQRPAEHAVIDLRNVPGFSPDSRFPHPLVVAHATALFEANHVSVNQPPAGAQQQLAGQLHQHKRARTSSRAWGGSQIFLKTLTGKTVTLEAGRDTTVKELAEKVQDKEGIPCDQQRLITGGVQISAYPSRTLEDLNVQGGATVHLVLKLCGD